MQLTGLMLLPSLTGAALGMSVAGVALKRRQGPGWALFAAFGIAVALWCLGQTFWVLSESRDELVRVAKWQYTAIILTPSIWFAFVLAHTGRHAWLRPMAVACWITVPLLSLVIAWSYREGHPNPLWRGFLMPPEVTVPQTMYGPWFWFMVTYNYALFFGGIGMLLAHYAQSPHYRGQLLAAAGAPLLLMLLNLSFIAGVWPFPLDPTPMGFSVGFAILGWSVLRHRLFDLSPLGRALAFDSMQESAIVLDSLQRVVDLNPAACRFIGSDAERILGRQALELLPGMPAVDERGDSVEFVLSLPGGRQIHVQRSAAPILDAERVMRGTVLILRDVTTEREAGDALREAQRRLEQANRDLERIAHTDALTGLANRRLLLSRLDEEFARARRHEAPLALMMIDLDHFKRVNDSYGHPVGDAVLHATGTMLRSLKRPADVAARYGGEELSLLLMDVDTDGAVAASCRVWKALGELIHKTPAGEDFHVTSSIGLAMLSAGDAMPADLVARADAALYVAKSGGRDRVVIAEQAGFRTVCEQD